MIKCQEDSEHLRPYLKQLHVVSWKQALTLNLQYNDHNSVLTNLWDGPLYLYKAQLAQFMIKRSNVQMSEVQSFAVEAVKGCGMGPWLVLDSPCFRENVVATCKIGFFFCSLDNLLQKNVVVFIFGNQMAKWRSFEKRAIFDLLFTFFSRQGKATKIPSAHISLTYIHVFCSRYWLFLPYQFWKNMNLSGTVSLWYESWCWFLFAPFWNNQ